MGLIILLVFVAVFGVTVLIFTAVGTGASKQTKQALALLDSALVNPEGDKDDEVLDIRRRELMSSIPWLNRWLIQIDVAPRIRVMLNQAEVKWTVGGLVLMAAAA